ncbi:MAG: hypothetical protein SNH63_03830 [Rikenellaceae bacterium]
MSLSKGIIVSYIAPIIVLVLCFCSLAYASAPQGDVSFWSAINPLTFLQGLVFALAFGFGLNIFFAYLVTAIIVAMLYMTIRWIVELIV